MIYGFLFLMGETYFVSQMRFWKNMKRFFKKKINSGLASRVISAILSNEYTSLVTPYFHFKLIQADEDDNKFVDCAVCGNAKVIVTEDHHFNVLREISFPKVDICSLDEIMNYL